MHALLFGVMLPSDISCQIIRSYIGTVTKLSGIRVGRAPQYQIRNLLVKAFHLIYYMTTFLKHYFFALDDHCPPIRKSLNISNSFPGMPRSVGRQYDDIILPVT